jgi:glycosyltransferase involved in cell wall biosynthesis
MNILWVTNTPLPEASLLMNENSIPFGGWLINAAKDLAKERNLSLKIAFPKKNLNGIQVLKGKDIHYYPFPFIKDSNRLSEREKLNLMRLIDQIKPEIVHVFGTEFAHSLAIIKVCNQKNIKTVLSIQGLVSMISRHYNIGLPNNWIRKSTFRDVIRKDNIYQQQMKFQKRGKQEVDAIKNVSHIIGRTTWDKACTSMINHDAKYYHCNETLRDIFYDYNWDINECEKYSIFLSQGSYPIKGLHFMVEAMALVVSKYPESKLYVGGIDITTSKTLKDKIKLSAYGKYIKALIKKNNLQNHIIFTGVLDERKMCEQYLRSHVFVCSSTIENSPNSLGEAMILGLPIVASNVGGISDLLTHKEEGFLYQSDAPYMLAFYICEIFRNEEIALNFSEKARLKAMMTHDKEQNHKRLLEIYQGIIEEGKIQEKGEFYESIS